MTRDILEKLASQIEAELGFTAEILQMGEPLDAEGIGIYLPDDTAVLFAHSDNGWLKIHPETEEVTSLSTAGGSLSSSRILVESAFTWLDSYRYWVTLMNFPPPMDEVLLRFKTGNPHFGKAMMSWKFLNEAASGKRIRDSDSREIAAVYVDLLRDPPASEVKQLQQLLVQSEKAGELLADQMAQELQRKTKPHADEGRVGPSRALIWTITFIISALIGIGAALGY